LQGKETRQKEAEKDNETKERGQQTSKNPMAHW
jgi:hypothetical protein